MTRQCNEGEELLGEPVPEMKVVACPDENLEAIAHGFEQAKRLGGSKAGNLSPALG